MNKPICPFCGREMSFVDGGLRYWLCEHGAVEVDMGCFRGPIDDPDGSKVRAQIAEMEKRMHDGHAELSKNVGELPATCGECAWHERANNEHLQCELLRGRVAELEKGIEGLDTLYRGAIKTCEDWYKSYSELRDKCGNAEAGLNVAITERNIERANAKRFVARIAELEQTINVCYATQENLRARLAAAQDAAKNAQRFVEQVGMATGRSFIPPESITDRDVVLSAVEACANAAKALEEALRSIAFLQTSEKDAPWPWFAKQMSETARKALIDTGRISAETEVGEANMPLAAVTAALAAKEEK